MRRLLMLIVAAILHFWMCSWTQRNDVYPTDVFYSAANQWSCFNRPSVEHALARDVGVTLPIVLVLGAVLLPWRIRAKVGNLSITRDGRDVSGGISMHKFREHVQAEVDRIMHHRLGSNGERPADQMSATTPAPPPPPPRPPLQDRGGV